MDLDELKLGLVRVFTEAVAWSDIGHHAPRMRAILRPLPEDIQALPSRDRHLFWSGGAI